MNSNEAWRDNSVQFPRLLAEINAIGLARAQMQELANSMDIEGHELDELFDRATVEFDSIKRSL